MKIYVAAKWERRERAREIMDLLKQQGHVITHDWTHEDDSEMDERERDEYLEECAGQDEDGVHECEVFVIEPTTGCKGAWVEFGIARSADKPIIVIDPEKRRECIFERMPNVRHVPDLAALVDELDDIERSGYYSRGDW